MTWEELYHQLGHALKANPELGSDEAKFLQNWTDIEGEDGLESDDVDMQCDIIDNIEYTIQRTIVLTS